MTFLNPEILFLLPGALVLGLIYRLGLEKAWGRFRPWNPGRTLSGAWIRPGLWGGAGLLVILALARPVGEPSREMRDLPGQSTVFLVDVSWSMLTPDMVPDRLEATKSALIRLLPDLEGDKAGLVAFSGTSVILSPLTSDRGFLTQTVKGLKAGLASRGGTLVGDALRQVGKTFGQSAGALNVWLFTDGGDQESFPVEAAEDLGKQGHRLLIWGLGTDQGGQVPDREVASRLNRDLLKAMAAATPGGQYYEGDPGSFPGIYRENRTASGTKSVIEGTRAEMGYWLVLGAFILLLGEFLLSFPRPKERS